MQWYYSNQGNQEGPVSEAEIKAMIASGEIRAGDLAWNEQMEDWTPVSKIEELKLVLPVVSEPANPTAPSKVVPQVTVSPYQPPSALGQMPMQPVTEDIPTYLWQAIVVTLFCCMPFGIAAIVYAAKVEPLKTAGDAVGARAASNSAKMWVNISVGIGLVFIVFALVSNG